MLTAGFKVICLSVKTGGIITELLQISNSLSQRSLIVPVHTYTHIYEDSVKFNAELVMKSVKHVFSMFYKMH